MPSGRLSHRYSPPLGATHSTPRDGPQKLLARPQDRVDLAAILAAEPFDVPVEQPHLDHRGHQHLIEVGRAEIDVPLLGQHRLGQTLRQHSPTDANARRKRLRERAGVEHGVAFRVERPQAGHVVAFVAKLAVGGVFDHVDSLPPRPALGDLDQRGPALERDRQRAGIVEIADQVDRLDPLQFAGGLASGQFLLDGLGNHAAVVGFHSHGPHAQIAQRAEEDVVARRGADHDVAGVQQHVGRQKEQLVAAGHDDDVLDADVQLGGSAAVGLEHSIEHGLAQGEMAERRAILQGRPGQGVVRPDSLQRLPGRLDRAGFRDPQSRRPARSGWGGPTPWPPSRLTSDSPPAHWPCRLRCFRSSVITIAARDGCSLEGCSSWQHRRN